jgi:uncharacterized membrane protein
MLRDKLIEKQIGAQSDFRWRSREITRIEGFSDAVFAFAVTLLVVSLEVPKTFSELWETMSGFGAFAIGFAFLLFIWFTQYKFFRRYGLQDATTIMLNGLLLFVVLFFTYPLKFLFTTLVKAFTGQELSVHLPDGTVVAPILPEQWPQLMVTYSFGYICIFAAFTLLYLHAWRKRAELQLSPLELFDTRTGLRENLLNASFGLLSILIVMIGGQESAVWSGMVYMFVGPAMTLHGILSGKSRRSLEIQPAPPKQDNS